MRNMIKHAEMERTSVLEKQVCYLRLMIRNGQLQRKVCFLSEDLNDAIIVVQDCKLRSVMISKLLI